MPTWNVNGPKLTQAEVERRRMAGERLKLAVSAHQGMGDHIICAGLYRTLAEDWDVDLLVLDKYVANVRALLWDVPAINIIPIAKEDQKFQYCDGICDRVVLRLGFAADIPFNTNHFDREFYRHAQVPWESRWSKFRCPDVSQVPAPDYKYTFVHDRPDMFNAVLTMPGIRPDPKASIFAHRDLILKASELHCVSSSFAAFADSLDLRGKALFFHPFGREVQSLRHEWEIVR